MRALDLFCCSGGASMGLHQAGFEVMGVDINPKLSKAYPFNIIHSDATKLDLGFLNNFDFIWASPPCQAYSRSTIKWRNQGKQYPDLIKITREILLNTSLPFVIENVVGAPIRQDLLLCGEMFKLKVLRHRIFELHRFFAPQLLHKEHKGTIWHGEYIGVWGGGRPGCFGNETHRKYYSTVVGHGEAGGRGNCSVKAWQEAMGIDWVKDKKALAEAIPPAYAKYIGDHAIRSIKGLGQQMLAQY